jgi:hypothetical protein
LHASLLTDVNTLSSCKLLGPTLLRSHTCGAVALKLLLCLLKGALRAGGLNVAELTTQTFFRNPLLNALPAAAESPCPDCRSVATGLHAAELLDRVVLLPTDNGLHVWVHVLLSLGTTKLSGRVILELIYASGRKLSRLLLAELARHLPEPTHGALGLTEACNGLAGNTLDHLLGLTKR